MRAPSLLAGLLLAALPAALPGQAVSDPWAEGVALLEEGDWEAALDTWYDAWNALSLEGVHDPRIGVAYAREVAARELRGEYENAAAIYAWGFSGTELAPYRETVGAEVARVAPLMEPSDSAALVALLEADDPEVLRRIRTFWLGKDPTPETRENERLLEHWERIAYARENFTRGRYGPYETDDRGTIHVKFGPPDRKNAGSLGAREDELRIWVRDPLAREQIRRYDTNPQYEIWVYDRLNPSEFVYFLFGNVEGTGPFHLVEGPDRLIPDEAYSPSTRRWTPGGVKAAYYLQLFYYSDLSRVGGPYARRFSELETIWARNEGLGGGRAAPAESTLEAFDVRYQQEDAHHRTDVPTVPDFSELDDGTRSVEVVVEPVRVLSPDNEPQLYVVALSAPKTRMESTAGRIRRRDIAAVDPDYRATHTLIVRDEAFREIGRIAETVSPATAGMSVFVLRHVPERLHYSVVVDVERDADEARLETSRLPGRAHFEAGAPLATDPGVLELSDVVTGVAPTAEDEYEGLPFPIVPSRSIWREDPIRLYLELYHLSRDGQGVARYRYDFTIAPLDQDGRVDRTIPPVTLSMPLEFQAATARDVFDIDIRALPVGGARVSVVATDVVTGREVRREVDIEIAR